MTRAAAYARVLCPYFVGHSSVTVSCRWFGGRVLTQRFVAPPMRAAHMDRFCACWDYRRCPLAAVMEAAYRARRETPGVRPGALPPDPRSRDISLENPCIGEGIGEEESGQDGDEGHR